MTEDELRDWMFSRSLEDQWWLSLDGVVEPEPMTLAEIKERLEWGDYADRKVLHRSQAKRGQQPWRDWSVPQKIRREFIPTPLIASESRTPLISVRWQQIAGQCAGALIGVLMLIGLIAIAWNRTSDSSPTARDRARWEAEDKRHWEAEKRKAEAEKRIRKLPSMAWTDPAVMQARREIIESMGSFHTPSFVRTPYETMRPGEQAAFRSLVNGHCSQETRDEFWRYVRGESADHSQDEFLESAESRPLRDKDELGLWAQDLPGKYRGLFIQFIKQDPRTVEMRRRAMSGGSEKLDTLAILSTDPIRIASTTEGEWFEIDEAGGLSAWDKDGLALQYRRLR